MSCVDYWTVCKDCKHETYSRLGDSECVVCGSTDLEHVREWDEQDDRHPEPVFEENEDEEI